ncbi:MAG: D-2-hydroxyacid dehydrogenase [Oscillospiraceae bacterium]|nr:D-2-hydroxyacid dehydrogenase [Oscillospiraceae bacterium]
MKIALLEEKTVTYGDASHGGISMSEFDELGEVVRYPLTPADKVVERAADCDAVIINKTLFTREVMEALPKLRYIGLCATGYNNVDLDAAREKGIAVTNVPAYSTNAVAEQVYAYILYFAKRIHEQASFTRGGGWIRSDTFSYLGIPAYELDGKTLGVVGFGSIGQRVCSIARAFGMKVLCCTRTPKEAEGISFTDIRTVFGESDYITVHCPLTPATEKMVNAELLSLCRPSAVFINTSRGGVVDERALAEALKDGRIAGAALDVLEHEPMTEDCPLYGANNCIITPHTGWAPRDTRERLIHTAADNLRQWMQGRTVNRVDCRIRHENQI